MYFQQVITYGNAWNDLVEHFPIEFEDIRASVESITSESIIAANPIRDIPHHQAPGLTRPRLEGCWTKTIESAGWVQPNAAIRNASVRPIHMRGLGFMKNRVSVSLQRHRELFNRWLYTLAPIAVRNGFVDIPIAIVLVQAAEEELFGNRPIMMRAPLERTKEELLALSPLSHSNAFLLIGIGLDDQCADIIEIESEGDAITRQVVINRSIEFPPEYHQAGLGILSYFGTVLREKYPHHNAKVKIEQDGLRVRLIIESENGDREVIEKALQEYEMVVRGVST